MNDPRLPDFTVVVPVEVMFRDIDAMGHLNNAVYLSYLEWARTKYWLGLQKSTDFWKIGFVVARAEIDYLSPAQMCETLLIGIRAEEIGVKSFTFGYRVVAVGEGDCVRPVAQARTVQVLFDWSSRRSVPIDTDLRARMEEFEGRLIPPPPPRR